MSDFYTVLRRSLDRADAPDEEQRQEIYDRLRTVIVRKLDAHRPRLKDTEFRQRLVAFDAAVVRIEDEIAASFAAADDVFDGLPYQGAPAAPPQEFADPDEDPEDEYDLPAATGEQPFLFDDEAEAEAPLEEYVAEEHDDPDAEPYDEPEPGDSVTEPVAYEPEEDPEGAGEPEPEWAPTPQPLPEPAAEEEEIAETTGPSTMWGSAAIDLAWDETTAQWHDPEEPVRPLALPASPRPSIQSPHPDSEWDRRLQMALVEETVRSRGAAAAPEWAPAEDDLEPQSDDAAFFEDGQWDPGTTPSDDADLPPAKAGRLGGVTGRLRLLSPGRLLRRRKADPKAAEPADPSSGHGGRVEPGFGMPMADAPPATVERRSSMRGITIDDGEEVFQDEPAHPLRTRRDDGPPPAPSESDSRRPSRPEPAVPPARPSARNASRAAERTEPAARPIRPTAAPPPSRFGDTDAAPRTNSSPRPAPPPPPPQDERDPSSGSEVNWPTRPAARGRFLPPPSPAATPLARDKAPPQRALRPRPAEPPAHERQAEQRSLAPAGNRAVRYLGSDLDEQPDDPVPGADDPLFADAMDAPVQRRRLPPPRNVPPEGKRVVYERSYGGRVLQIGVVSAIVVVLAVCAVLFVPGLLGLGDSTTSGGTGGQQGIVLFGGTDPLVFQAGPDNPVNFEGDTAGGLVRVVSSNAGAARATIGPGIAGGVEGQQVRIQLDVRSTPDRPASTLRLAYLHGNTLLEWRTVNVTGDFAIVDAIWTIPTGVPSPAGDALLIAPGVPGDGTAVDIRRITMDVGG